MNTWLLKIIRKLTYLVSALIILAALLVSVAGLLTPVLNQHRADFEKWASSLLNTPVMIGNVTVSWRGYSPEINLDQITILDVKSQKPKVEMAELQIDFNLWRTLLDRRIAIRHLKVDGVKLTVTAQKSGVIQVGNLGAINISDTKTGASLETAQAMAWLFSQPRLSLANIEVHIITPSRPDRFVSIMALSLKNDDQHHDVDGRLRLNQALPTRIDLHVAWDGDVRNMQMNKGDFYLYFEGLSLPQWFSTLSWQGFQVKNGLASIKLWARWQDSQWKKIQSTFQIYGLETYSQLTKQITRIDRISGKAGWKQQGQTQLFAGDEIFIDFPDHLWPETDFEVILNNNASGPATLKSILCNYLNLNDIIRMALDSSALPETWRQNIIALNPQGELKELNAEIAHSITEVNGISLQTQFSGLSLNAWRSYPGVSYLDGKLQWDKTDGVLDLNDSQVTLAIPSLFLHPFHLEQLTASVKLHQDASGNQSIMAKNIQLKTHNAAVNGKFALTLPTTGSPQIDLSADFTTNRVARIVDYLPMKIFDPDLQDWLKQAFKNGNTDAGKIILQGKLDDFPFDHHQGQFLISTAVHDTDLNFAPDWPAIHHIEGQLTFHGRGMTIDIQNGQLLDIPLHNIHGEIPFIGDAQPQILHVNGIVNADLAQGLGFIQASPLQKTLGKNLNGMQLQGPMQLTLGLVVPLRHPGLTTVNGAVTLNQASMLLPAWKLNFSQLNGAFQFTEQGIEAKQITGILFNAPATLDITTTMQKPVSQIRADVAGQISIPQLEAWSGLSLSSIATGATAIQAKLLLSDHAQSKSNEVFIHSDLVGIALKAPMTLGKIADEKKNLDVNLTLGEKNSLNAKVDYANQLISSALTLIPAKQGYEMYGGEVRLSSGAATLQKAKGILVIGTLPQLDWAIWQDYFNSLQKPGVSTLSSVQDYLRGVDLTTKLISAAGQQIHNAHLNVTLNDTAWLIKLDSTEVSGGFTLPFTLAGNTIEGQIRHLTLGAPSNAPSTNNSLSPAQFPALSFLFDEININGIKMNHVTLRTLPGKNGMQIKRLSVDDPLLQLQASGNWAGTASRSTSRLQGTANTQHISELLKRWGFDTNNFVGSTGDVTFNLNWPDAPYRLSLAGLTGDLAFKFGEGRIVELSESSNAKIGLGRMLNLFSLSSIPRRLSLHFNDLFEKGYSFDLLSANFILRSGSAFTDNMRFDGPIASVAIKGRVGLKAKDCDLQLGVTPYVTGSLPLVATLAGGPVAGVATWVVDKMITSQAAHTTTYQYNVKGPWSNPVWSPITAISQHPSLNTVFPFSLFTPTQPLNARS